MRAELISAQLKDSMGQSSTQSRVSVCLTFDLHNETWDLINKMHMHIWSYRKWEINQDL